MRQLPQRSSPPCSQTNSASLLPFLPEHGLWQGMDDDNTTPRWALLWFARHQGRGADYRLDDRPRLAVRPRPSGLHCLANLVMLPEALGVITENGPPRPLPTLARLLRLRLEAHRACEPGKPPTTTNLPWQYLPMELDPRRVTPGQNELPQKGACWPFGRSWVAVRSGVTIVNRSRSAEVR